MLWKTWDEGLPLSHDISDKGNISCLAIWLLSELPDHDGHSQSSQDKMEQQTHSYCQNLPELHLVLLLSPVTSSSSNNLHAGMRAHSVFPYHEQLPQAEAVKFNHITSLLLLDIARVRGRGKVKLLFLVAIPGLPQCLILSSVYRVSLQSLADVDAALTI